MFSISLQLHASYRSFATRVSQLKTCDFSGETFKGFEMFSFSMSGTTQRDCSSGVSFANCVMSLYLLKVDLQTFLSIPVTQK